MVRMLGVDNPRRNMAAVLAAVCVGAAGCIAPPERGPVRAIDNENTSASWDGEVLSVPVETCNGDPEIVQLDETADQVVVTIESDRQGGEVPACLDYARVELDAPPGERTVLDSTSGQELRVRDLTN